MQYTAGIVINVHWECCCFCCFHCCSHYCLHPVECIIIRIKEWLQSASNLLARTYWLCGSWSTVVHLYNQLIWQGPTIDLQPADSFNAVLCLYSSVQVPHVGPGHPSSPLSIYFLIFSTFYFSLSFIGFTYFLLLSIPPLSTRIVPLRFQAGGRRRRPNLCLVCVLLCNLCYLYSLVKMDCGVLFYLV